VAPPGATNVDTTGASLSDQYSSSMLCARSADRDPSNHNNWRSTVGRNRRLSAVCALARRRYTDPLGGTETATARISTNTNVIDDGNRQDVFRALVHIGALFTGPRL
jgi:hypothetical protein